MFLKIILAIGESSFVVEQLFLNGIGYRTILQKKYYINIILVFKYQNKSIMLTNDREYDILRKIRKVYLKERQNHGKRSR